MPQVRRCACGPAGTRSRRGRRPSRTRTWPGRSGSRSRGRLERVVVPRHVRGDVHGLPGLQSVGLPEWLKPQLQLLRGAVLHQHRHRVPQLLDRPEAEVPGLGHVRLQRFDEPIDAVVRPPGRVLFVHVIIVAPVASPGLSSAPRPRPG